MSPCFDAAIRDSVGRSERLEVDLLRREHDGLKVCGICGCLDVEPLKDSTAVVVTDNDLYRTGNQRERTRIIGRGEIPENKARDANWGIGAARGRGNSLSGRYRSVNSRKSAVGVNPNRLPWHNRVGDSNDGRGSENQPIVGPRGVPDQSHDHVTRHGLSLNFHFPSGEGGPRGVIVNETAVNVRRWFRHLSIKRHS